ncbi:hypothetical protein ACFQJ5_04045 [Halomicroarcula sp. GCM10025324]|uniref:DUF7344 domain-containing protein n=1 Tax=Haloarcula TaxID=2237 RepID=UPI0023E86045|nr:hypothetical protein [Halomicroarcula sp. ZS-22-S1]
MNARKHQPRSSRGDAWDILGSRRRRVVLAVVSETDGAVERAQLARRVAALEEGTRAVEVNHDVERATEIRLHHVDLPRLAAADLVHYDPDLGIVENDELPLEGEEWLEMPVVEALRTWNGYR